MMCISEIELLYIRRKVRAQIKPYASVNSAHVPTSVVRSVRLKRYWNSLR